MLPALTPVDLTETHVDKHPSHQMSQIEETRRAFNAANEKYLRGETSVLDVLNEKTRLDLAKSLYNETDAYIPEAFGKIVEKIFADRSIEFEQGTGFIKAHELDSVKTVWGVTLPNLPLINSIESHLGGNRDLRRTTDVIEKVASDDNPFIVHNRGADFLVYTQTDKTKNAQIGTNVENSQWEPILGTNETPYLISCNATVANAVLVFNKMQAIRALETPEDLATTANQAKKEITGILLAIIQYQKESKKAESVCQRFIETSHDETYFNSHVKIYFEAGGYDTFEKVRLLAQNKTHADAEIKRIADICGMRSLEEGSDGTKAYAVISELVSRIADEKLLIPNIQPTISESTNTLLSLPLSELHTKVMALRLTREFINEIETESDDKIALVDETYTTQHTLQTIELVKIVSDVQTAYEAIGQLNLNQIEKLLEISQFSEEIKKSIVQELKTQSPELIEKFIELAKARLQIYLVKHDKLTGLPTRYEFYRESNEWLKETIEKGEQCGLISMDLGFLNYFNKKGNRPTGDRAIKIAIIQMEDELKKTYGENWDKVIKIYRYAGDEISILYKGSPEIKNALEDILRNLNTFGREIPPTDNLSKSSTYTPEKIQYNYGSCPISLGEIGLEKLLDTKNIYDEREEHMLRKILELRADLRNADILRSLDVYSIYNKGMREQVLSAAEKFVEKFGNEEKPKYTKTLSRLRHSHDLYTVTILSELNHLAEKNYQTIKETYAEAISKVPRAEKDFYYETLGKAMVRIGDRMIDHHKTYERFQLLYARYADIKRTDDAKTQEQKETQLNVLLTFSGKAFFGKDIKVLEDVYEKYTATPNSGSPWKIFKQLILDETAREKKGEMEMSRLSYMDDLPNVVLNQLVRDMSLELLLG